MPLLFEDESEQRASRLHTRRRRLLAASIIVGLLVLLAVAAIGGGYWWFSAKVQDANSRIDPATEEALRTPPPSTLVSIPEMPSSNGGASGAGTESATRGAEVSPPGEPPLDIIVLGSDPRPGTVEAPGSSDVIMLIHVDRAHDYLSILSVTRDLYVDIPGYGEDRINAAYTFGGPPLAVATLKQTFGIDATRYLELGFEAFEGMIDSVGGVFVDVDRDYPRTETWEVGIGPGYQLLDGKHALSFSRYRDDQYSDFGRMARQQRVLSALREQLIGWDLPLKLPGIVKLVLGAAATNLTTNELMRLGYWMGKLDSNRIKRVMVTGSAQMIGGKAVIVAGEESLKQAVTDLLTPPRTTAAETVYRGRPTSTTLLTASAMPLSLSMATAEQQALDMTMWQAAQGGVPFALEAPGFLPDGYSYASTVPGRGGTYQIAPGDDNKPAVRVIYRNGDDYIGITATTWTDAPLATGGTEVESDGVIYTMVGSGAGVDHIWWRKADVLYFVSNSLMCSVSWDELLEMAKSMRPVSRGA